MLGFFPLFVAWGVLGAWAWGLSRRGGPAAAGTVAWGTGGLLGLCVGLALFGVYQMVTAYSSVAPGTAPETGGPDWLAVASYGAHGVVGLGYVAMLGITGMWLTGGGAGASGGTTR